MKTDQLTYFGVVTPCYIIEEELLRRNLELIKSVADRAGVEIILAFKAFALSEEVEEEAKIADSESGLNDRFPVREAVHRTVIQYLGAASLPRWNIPPRVKFT